METLGYASPQAPAQVTNQIGLLAWGLLPTLIYGFTQFDNIVTGDPVESVERFTAYHYISALIELMLLVWIVVLYRSVPAKSRWWVMTIALAWALVNTYWVYLFIDDVRTDPASSYYFSIWRPFGWLGIG